MFNREFRYPHMELWEEQAWKKKKCDAYPLLLWIEQTNCSQFRITIAPDAFVGRTDVVDNPHSGSEAYQGILDIWEAQGLNYRISRMGDLRWFVLIPDSVAKKKNREPKVLVVQCSIDYSDKRYAMEILRHYEFYNRMAAEQDMVVLYTASNTPDRDNLLSAVLMELGSLYYIDLTQLYLDVSPVFRAGKKLSDIEDFVYRNSDGDILNADEQVEYWGEIPVLNIYNRWQTRVSNLYSTATAIRMKNGLFDLDQHIHSICGQKMAEAMVLEYSFDDGADAGLSEYWKKRGAEYHLHETKGQRWVSLSPSGAKANEKLPAMLIFRETTKNNPYLPLIALSGFYSYCELAAQGDMILLFFALETPDDNDLFYDILQEATGIYPIDRSRVYVAGHSHNGFYACEFMRRHHGEIAGVATQGNSMGLYGPSYAGPPRLVPDEAIAQMSHYDMPLINLCGTAENDYTNLDPASKAYENMVDAFQRRLRSARCPEKTKEEIRAARTSPDYAVRKLGVPVDRAEVIYMYGRECYCGYLKNFEGKELLKLVVVENLPHITIPQTGELSWSFLRRFARDLSTGKLVELY